MVNNIIHDNCIKCVISIFYKFEDIYQVASFGFRGEAMPSIASIARGELLTRRKEDLAGTKAVVEAGTIKEILPAGCPVGTQIFVNNIFANIPARKKFLKKEYIISSQYKEDFKATCDFFINFFFN